MYIVYPPREPEPLDYALVAKRYNELRRQLLRENLYPLLEPLEPETADQAIEMLLKMGSYLHLPESRDAAKAKFAEAMELLRNTAVPNNNSHHDHHGVLSKL